MNIRSVVFVVLAAFSVSSSRADIVSGKAALSVKSMFVNYGVVKGKDPIFVPVAGVSFYDTLYFGVFALCDMTEGNGKRGGYGNRAGKYRKLNPSVGIRHGFDLGETFGTLVADVGYMYEYVPRVRGKVFDTQFVNTRFSLPDLWLEPSLWIERDFMLDDGTYVYFEIGHAFPVTDSLSIRPAVGQGFGDAKRSAAFEQPEFRHGGIMDSTVRIDLTYSVTEWLSLGAYAAYHDFLFDGNMRDAARRANRAWGSAVDRSWNFTCGVLMAVTF